MTTVTRDPERLPVRAPRADDPHTSYPIPWQAQPSFFAAIEIELPNGEILTSPEIERITEKPRTHRAFMERYPLHPDGKVMYWSEWLRWQRTRDPIKEDLQAAELVRARLIRESRGPGISRRR